MNASRVALDPVISKNHIMTSNGPKIQSCGTLLNNYNSFFTATRLLHFLRIRFGNFASADNFSILVFLVFITIIHF